MMKNRIHRRKQTLNNCICPTHLYLDITHQESFTMFKGVYVVRSIFFLVFVRLLFILVAFLHFCNGFMCMSPICEFEFPLWYLLILVSLISYYGLCLRVKVSAVQNI